MSLKIGLSGLALLVVVGINYSQAEERAPRWERKEFNRLHKLIQPQPGESPWREIPWFTSITEARQQSVRENKPIVIFTAADGSPLGRT